MCSSPLQDLRASALEPSSFGGYKDQVFLLPLLKLLVGFLFLMLLLSKGVCFFVFLRFGCDFRSGNLAAWIFDRLERKKECSGFGFNFVSC